MSNPPPTPSMPSGPAGLRPGDQLDKYTIVEQIGAGGMAIVWKGHDPVLNRVVAIKAFNAAAIDAQGDDLASRFRAEAALQKRLAKSSPHLVHVLDFIDEDRGLFIVMEYVEGKSLEQLLAGNPQPMEQRQALGIIGAVALALGVIHQQGVVHRDLKPSNILLPLKGGLKVSDFGLAAIMGDQEAMAVGTVRYMAPELFHDETVDGKADIYSLGMIAYEMLAGREKCNEAFKVVLRDQRNQALRWMKWHTNPRAKAPPLVQINPAIPTGLSELVARMMEKDPAARVASSQELLEAMRRLLASAPAASAPASADAAQTPSPEIAANPTAAIPKNRHRLPWILTAILLLQVMIFGGLLLHQQHKKKQSALAHEAQGQDQYNQAVEDYKAGQYAQAHDAFTAVLTGWKDHPRLSVAAQAGVHLTQAQLDLAQGQYNQALEQVEQARQLNVFKAATLDDLRQEAQSRGAFQGELAAINDMMDRGELGMAGERLLKLSAVSPQEHEAIDAINGRLQGLQSQARDLRTIAEAQAERDKSGLPAGIRYLEMQLNVRPSERVQATLKEWKDDQTYQTLLNQARQDERDNKLADAIRKLNQAQGIRAQPSLASQIRNLEIRSLIAQAQQAEQAGNANAAANLYTRVLGMDKDSTQAKDALARIDVSNRRNGFLQAAQTAFNNKQYDQAIQQFQNAIELGDDPQARQQLTTARLHQAMEASRVALENNELETARQQIEVAQSLVEDHDQVRQLAEQIANRQQYLRHLATGDTLRDQAKYSEAQREYLSAQRIARTGQITQRLADTEILHMLAQARYYMSKQEWRTARAMLRTLLDKRPHDEARQLLEEVNKHLPTPAEDEHAN